MANAFTHNGDEQALLVCAHIKALRRKGCFESSTIVVLPEANLMENAQVIAREASKIDDVFIGCSEATHFGVKTKSGMRLRYTAVTSDRLKNDAVRYHDPLTCANPFNPTDKSEAQLVAAAKTEFQRQLLAFQRVGYPARSAMSNDRQTVSGVTDEDGTRANNLKDDMVLAFMFGLFYAQSHVGGRLDTCNHSGQLVVLPEQAAFIRSRKRRRRP